MKKIIMFGTSFVNTFISLKSNFFSIIKFKGAMIKGLVNKNKNYNDIINILDTKKYHYGMFVFGDPDCLFYYYKKKYINNVNENIIEDSFYKNVEEYVKLVSKFKNIENKYILGVSPPTVIKDEDFRKSLHIYGILTEEESKKVSKKDLKYNFRLNRFIQFNKTLEESCIKYNVNFCNIFDYLLDKKYRINNVFKLKFNPYNIHYNFEAVLIVYLNSCLSFLCDKKILFSYEDIIKKIKETSENYLKGVFKVNSLEKDHKNYILNIKKIENLVKLSIV
jgi:predicted RNA-binding protein YlxR (DUF448 family)